MRQLFLSRQTHYMVLVWTFTWFAYWLFLRSQFVLLNVAGTVVSAGILAFMRFSSARSVATKALKLATPQINKSVHVHVSRVALSPHVAPKSESCTPKPIPSFFAAKISVASKASVYDSVQVHKAPVKLVAIEAEAEPDKQECVPAEVVEKPGVQSTVSGGCPKDLEYYSKKPRPKQTPTECFSCKNLISCVCQTSD